MKKSFNGYANKGGVYKITNLKNGKIYIGSAKNFKKRAYQHYLSLERQKHSNKHLQSSWNKWGEDAFLFEVLEVVEGNKGSRFKVEQKHINKLILEDKWEQTFNFKKKAEQKERSTFSKSPELTRQRLSKAQRKRYSKPEERKKISEGLIGRPVSKKTREKIAKSLKGKQNALGFKQTEQAKEKIRKALSNRSKHIRRKISAAKSRAVIQLSPDGHEVKTWPSAREAAKTLRISASSIMNGCQQDRISCGFRWKYKEPNKHKPWSDEEVNNAYQLYVKNGYNIAKTAQTIGRTYGQVYGKFRHKNLLDEHSQDYTRFRKSLDGQGIK